jgi:hypothetical protein
MYSETLFNVVGFGSLANRMRMGKRKSWLFSGEVLRICSTIEPQNLENNVYIVQKCYTV